MFASEIIPSSSIFSTILAVIVGLVLVNVFEPGANFDANTIRVTNNIESSASEKINLANKVSSEGPLQFVVDLVPTNIFAAASNNANMLQVIFFAILLGIAINYLPKDLNKSAVSFFDAMYRAVLRITTWIIKLAPIGVFALIAHFLADVSYAFLDPRIRIKSQG